MQLPHDPFPLIFEGGDAAVRLWCLELFGLQRSPRATEDLEALLAQQLPGGGFPGGSDQEEWGIRETIRHGLLLSQLGLTPGDAPLQRVSHFAAQVQRADGSWAENPRLPLDPFTQTFLSSTDGVTWITADAVDLMRAADLVRHPGYPTALAWLREAQNAQGGWPSVAGCRPPAGGGAVDPDATAAIAFLLGEVYGEEDPCYVRGRHCFEESVDDAARDARRGYHVRARDSQPVGIDVYGLTHLLLSWLGDRPRRIRAGYDVRDLRIRDMMSALISLQGSDGGWQPFWAAGSSPQYTALAVKTLVLTGAVEPESLPDMRRYALGSEG